MKAARAYGRAVKAQDVGDSRKALEEGRQALKVLSSPSIDREKPWIGTLLAMGTQMVDHHAHRLGERGASLSDLQDALHFLRKCADRTGNQDFGDSASINYLEARIAYIKANNMP
jgi:superfamily I DNA/RNA helicase